MPAKSKAQQRFFGMIYGAKKQHKEDELSGKAKEVADKLRNFSKLYFKIREKNYEKNEKRYFK